MSESRAHTIPVVFTAIAESREQAARQVVGRLERALVVTADGVLARDERGNPQVGVTGDELVDSYTLPNDWRCFDLEDPGMRIAYRLDGLGPSELRDGDTIAGGDGGEVVTLDDDGEPMIQWYAGNASGWDPPEAGATYSVLRYEEESQP